MRNQYANLFRMPIKTAVALKRLASRQDRSMSEVVRTLIRDAAEREFGIPFDQMPETEDEAEELREKIW
jgi:hypothetical protein